MEGTTMPIYDRRMNHFTGKEQYIETPRSTAVYDQVVKFMTILNIAESELAQIELLTSGILDADSKGRFAFNGRELQCRRAYWYWITQYQQEWKKLQRDSLQYPTYSALFANI